MTDRSTPPFALRSAGPRPLLIALAAGILSAACAATSTGDSVGSSARPTAPGPGAAGMGDPYYPESGNGGYDVAHYDLVLDVDMEADTIDAVATLTAHALQDLTSFNLDLYGLEVTAVLVNGDPASFRRRDSELIVEPGRVLAAGASFDVRVEYGGKPDVVPDAAVMNMGIPGVGWWRTESGVHVISECTGAPSWFPCNDHPLDKATFSFRVTVDAPYVVAANGLLIKETEQDGKRTYEWKASDPMATYLATMNIAKFELELSEGPHGMPLRLYYPIGAEEEELEAFARTYEMIETFETFFGPYPFECFGGVMAYEQLGGALETQTLPVYSRGVREGVVAHELAHQWFGDCVSPARWQDMWLNEGFAVYGEWLWREHTKGREALERRAGQTYRYLRKREVGPPSDPGVEQLFSGRVYQRGAWVLHALRREVGDETFFEILQRWVIDHHDGNASTPDFVAHCERVADRELKSLFDAWLYGAVIPEVPEYERKSRRQREAEASRDAGESTGDGEDVEGAH